LTKDKVLFVKAQQATIHIEKW